LNVDLEEIGRGLFNVHSNISLERVWKTTKYFRIPLFGTRFESKTFGIRGRCSYHSPM